MLQVAGGTSCQARHPLGYVFGVRCLEVGAVDRRSEEQGLEARSSATQLPLGSQTCLVCHGRTP